jgi:hypothetical protein
MGKVVKWTALNAVTIGGVCLLTFTAQAEPGKKRLALGFRGSVSATRHDIAFDQYEIFASYALPERWRWPAGLDLGFELEGTAGTISAAGETAFIGFLGPRLSLYFLESIVSIEAGSRPAVLSRDRFGGIDLGGRFHFISHLGIRVRLGRFLSVGYRFQHMSNAGLQDPNPGLNLHMLELSSRF